MSLSNSLPGLVVAVLFTVLSGALPGQIPVPGTKPADPKPGALRFKANEVDLGRIRDEKSVDCVFHFVNRSERSVTLKDVKAACGCTIVKFDQQAYGPGIEGQIRVQFNPVGRQGKERKPITVETDDPIMPRCEVYVAVEVIPRMGIEPRSIWIGELKRGERCPAKSITITTLVSDFQIRSAISDDPRFTVTPVSHESAVVDGEKGTRDTFEVTFLGDKDVSHVQSLAIFETNDARMPKIQVSLAGRVVGDLRLSPDIVHLRLVKAGAPFTQSIQVSSRSNRPFKVLGASTTGREDMSMEVVEEAPDPKFPAIHKLTLRGTTPTLDPKTGNTFQGAITLRTDIPDQPEATIPINGFIMTPPPVTSAAAPK